MSETQQMQHARKSSPLLRPEYVRFFIPLAVQAMAQSLSHPLVAMVASHAPGGTLNMAGLSQSSNIAYLIQTLNIGLLAMGMVYGKSREGFRGFLRAWAVLGVITTGITGVLAIPFFSHLLFGRIIGLPESIERPAQIAFAVGLPVRVLFHLRMPYQLALLNNLQSGKASAASVVRVGMTLLLAPVFVRAGLMGPAWAMVCLMIPVAVEVAGVYVMGRPYVRALESDPDRRSPPLGRLLAFTLPLSLSNTLAVFSFSILAAFMARAPEPELVLPVYQLAVSVVGPLIYGMSQIQQVVLAFAPDCLRRCDTLRFAIVMGIIGGLAPLIFQIEPLRTLYFVKMQNLSPDLFGPLRLVALMAMVQPFMMALRSRLQGIASYMRTTMPILMAFTALLLVLVAVGWFSLWVGIPGLYIGPLGIFCGNVTAILFLRLTVGRREEVPSARQVEG